MIHEYDTNSEEADCRIWRHATCCSVNNVLIYSPHTNVYNIGLHYLSTASSKQYIIQINVINAISKEYIFLNHLHTAFFNDPDLSSIVKPNLLNTLQTLFICTGCDFVSFFKQIGKASFFNYFFQHSCFICGNSMDGSLHETDINTRSSGFLSFIRLIGTIYYKKHLPSFISLDIWT